MNNIPGFYGIYNSNRNFSDPKAWGKNQFNSTFPLSLSLYMSDTSRLPVYLMTDRDLGLVHENISTKNAFGIDDSVDNKDVFCGFETISSQDQLLNGLGVGNSTRSDIVLYLIDGDSSSHGMEAKLTVIPDNSTINKHHDSQSGELVIRPVSILHLANVLAYSYTERKAELYSLLDIVTKHFPTNEQWQNLDLLYSQLENFVIVFESILKNSVDDQVPVLLHTIWRTEGKSPRLAEDTLDVFFWSSHAFAKLFFDSINIEKILNKRDSKLERKTRAVIWIIKMLDAYVKTEKIPGESIIQSFSYGNQTDKAFAVNGSLTFPFLSGKELFKPRVTRNEIDNIILGHGERFLSPERRFDASLFFESGLD